MAKIFGAHQCEKCKNLIKWEYLIPQNIHNGYFDIDIIDRTSVDARCLSSNKNIYQLRVICPNCLIDNTFEYKTDSKE